MYIKKVKTVSEKLQVMGICLVPMSIEQGELFYVTILAIDEGPWLTGFNPGGNPVQAFLRQALSL